MATAAGATAAAVLAAGCGSSAVTEVVVEIRSDLATPDELDAVEVQIASLPAKVYGLDGGRQLPVVLGLVPRDGQSDRFAVVARALHGGAALAPPLEQRWDLAFVPGKVMKLGMFLSRLCQQRASPCADTETCEARDGAGVCVGRGAGLVPYGPTDAASPMPDRGADRPDATGAGGAGDGSIDQPVDRSGGGGGAAGGSGGTSGTGGTGGRTGSGGSGGVGGRSGSGGAAGSGGRGAGGSGGGAGGGGSGGVGGGGSGGSGGVGGRSGSGGGTGGDGGRDGGGQGGVGGPDGGGDGSDAPVKKGLGVVCGDGTECDSGTCVDSVCCEGACGQACSSCNVPGREGRCAPDPRGAVCQPAACSADRTGVVQAGTCDGQGSCAPGLGVSCGAYRCAGGSCGERCGGDGDCVPPASCQAGSCGPKGPGAACTSGDQCASHICADGVCCTTECTGRCYSCKISGSPGTCLPVPWGDPARASECTAALPQSCGADGTCDGNGGCRRFIYGTPCTNKSCSGATFTPNKICDGAGACISNGDPSPCNPFACSGASCAVMCGSDADCSSDAFCPQPGGACELKRSNGQICAGPNQCKSNICSGVCGLATGGACSVSAQCASSCCSLSTCCSGALCVLCS